MSLTKADSLLAFGRRVDLKRQILNAYIFRNV